MNNASRDQVQSYGRSSVAVYMQQVYLWMTAALGVTALAAVFTASNMAIMQFLFTNTIMMVLVKRNCMMAMLEAVNTAARAVTPRAAVIQR